MSAFSRRAADAIAYENREIADRQLHIVLLGLWINCFDHLVSFLREDGAVKELPDRLVISVNKLRMAIVRMPHNRHRYSLEQHYEKLRKLASEGRFARFGHAMDWIEIAKPLFPTEHTDEAHKQSIFQIDGSPREHEIGEIRLGIDIGYDSPDNYIWANCSVCGKEEWYRLRENAKLEIPRCTDCRLLRKHNPPSIPKVKKHGYILIHLNQTDFFYSMANKYGYILEHRLVMARHLQRCLQPWEVVHHKNGDKTDNHLENLELVASIGEHIANHNTGYMGGYKHGLYEAKSDRIKALEARITELEAEQRVGCKI